MYKLYFQDYIPTHTHYKYNISNKESTFHKHPRHKYYQQNHRFHRRLPTVDTPNL